MVLSSYLPNICDAESTRKMNRVLQSLFQLLRSAGRVRGTLPLTVLKVLASLACHGEAKGSVYFLCSASSKIRVCH